MADKAHDDHGHGDHGHGHDDDHGHGDHGHDDHPQGPKVPVIVVPANSIEDSILRSISLVAFALLFAIVGFWRLSTEALPTPQSFEHGAGAEHGAAPEHGAGAEHGTAPEHGAVAPATGEPPDATSPAAPVATPPAATPPAGAAPATAPAATPPATPPADQHSH